jgi:hypothetical protein
LISANFETSPHAADTSRKQFKARRRNDLNDLAELIVGIPKGNAIAKRLDAPG